MPIGVFDSGLGGLTILSRLRAALPDQAFQARVIQPLLGTRPHLWDAWAPLGRPPFLSYP